MILTVASAAMTPASLDGLSLWLDASQTAPVDQPDALPDLSGNGNDLVWLNTTDAATLSEMRGLQAWTLSGSSRYSSTALTLPDNTPFTWAGVVQMPVGNAHRWIIYESTAQASRTQVYTLNGLLQGSVGGVVLDTPLIEENGFWRFSFILVARGAGSSLWMNGEKVDSMSTAPTYGRQLTYVSHGSNGLNGDLAEIMSIDRALTDVECADLSDYFRRKWRV